MPIRINLLAEAQAAEELRRHDPVKRAIFFGALAAAALLVWSSYVQLETMLAQKAVTDRQTEIQSRTNQFDRVLSDQKKVADAKQQTVALQTLAGSRFLEGNLLNALQKINVSNVQLMRIQVNQNYVSAPATPARKNGDRTIPGSPRSVTERITVTLTAQDSSPNPGDQVNKFKDAVASQSYFKTMLNPTNGVQLVNLSSPQTGTDGKPYVMFILECNFMEQTR